MKLAPGAQSERNAAGAQAEGTAAGAQAEGIAADAQAEGIAAGAQAEGTAASAQSERTAARVLAGRSPSPRTTSRGVRIRTGDARTGGVRSRTRGARVPGSGVSSSADVRSQQVAQLGRPGRGRSGHGAGSRGRRASGGTGTGARGAKRVRPPGGSAGGGEKSIATGTPSSTASGALAASTPSPASALAGPAGPTRVSAIPTTVGPPAGAAPRKRASARRSKGARGPRSARAAAAPGGGAAIVAAAVVAARPGPASGVHPLAARARPTVRGSSNLLERFGSHIPLPIPVPDWSKPIIVALLLLAIWFGVRSRLAVLRAGRLERQRARLLSDLGAVQAALVPEVPAQLAGLAVSVAYRPAEGPAAGGDFYDLFALAAGKVAIVLGDVAGHGRQALTHAALTRYTLRAYLQAGLEPRAALALAGQVLIDRSGVRFATVAVGIYDSDARTLTYSLAGHPPPIMLGFRSREPLTVCSSPPVGWGRPTGLRQTTLSLPPGAEACFFSDGLIEARRTGELLGRERLGEILAGLGPRPQASELLERVRGVAEGAPDDMVACILSPESSAAVECIHVEELEATRVALGHVGVQRFLEQCELGPVEISRTIELASAIAARSGTAVLRVELGPAGATAIAAAPGAAGRLARPARSQRAAEEPLLEALAAR
jgi:stage II sporulation SpoE-like protein